MAGHADAQRASSAGAWAERLPAGEVRVVSSGCFATAGDGAETPGAHAARGTSRAASSQVWGASPCGTDHRDDSASRGACLPRRPSGAADTPRTSGVGRAARAASARLRGARRLRLGTRNAQRGDTRQLRLGARRPNAQRGDTGQLRLVARSPITQRGARRLRLGTRGPNTQRTDTRQLRLGTRARSAQRGDTGQLWLGTRSPAPQRGACGARGPAAQRGDTQRVRLDGRGATDVRLVSGGGSSAGAVGGRSATAAEVRLVASDRRAPRGRADAERAPTEVRVVTCRLRAVRAGPRPSAASA